jgi:hypothetical protein
LANSRSISFIRLISSLQPRRLLEFEVGGGVAHAAFDVLEGGLEIGAGEGFAVFLHARGGQLVEDAALVRAGHDLA